MPAPRPFRVLQNSNFPLFVAESSIASYSEADLEKFLTDLAEIDKKTRIVTLYKCKSLLLNSSGKTAAGFSLSKQGLSQICKKLFDGLYRLLLDMATENLDAGRKKQELVIDIFNKILEAKFHQALSGYKMVVDENKKVIDGIISPDYQHLSNFNFAESVISKLKKQKDLQFFEAVVAGRWAMFRFYHLEPYLNFSYLNRSENFHGGLYFANHECGKGSVTSNLIIVRKADFSSSMLPLATSCRRRHKGVNFSKRIAAISDLSLRDLPDKKTLLEQFKKSSETRFWPENLVLDRDTVGPFLAKKFAYDIGLTLASKCVQSVFLSNPVKDYKKMPQMLVSEKDMKKRTFFDFYVSICREAKNYVSSIRERLESFALSLVSSQLQ